MATSPVQPDFTTQAKQWIVTWTPRLVVGASVGYYSLGVAYDLGVMAAVDKVAIYILKNTTGYLGVGAMMPTIQWYSAWAVRSVAALAGSLLYDLGEKIVLYSYNWWNKPPVDIISGSTNSHVKV